VSWIEEVSSWVESLVVLYSLISTSLFGLDLKLISVVICSREPGINDPPCPFRIQQVIPNSFISRHYVTGYAVVWKEGKGEILEEKKTNASDKGLGSLILKQWIHW
jgi:hypothetical protein